MGPVGAAGGGPRGRSLGPSRVNWVRLFRMKYVPDTDHQGNAEKIEVEGPMLIVWTSPGETNMWPVPRRHSQVASKGTDPLWWCDHLVRLQQSRLHRDEFLGPAPDKGCHLHEHSSTWPGGPSCQALTTQDNGPLSARDLSMALFCREKEVPHAKRLPADEGVESWEPGAMDEPGSRESQQGPPGSLPITVCHGCEGRMSGDGVGRGWGLELDETSPHKAAFGRKPVENRCSQVHEHFQRTHACVPGLAQAIRDFKLTFNFK